MKLACRGCGAGLSEVFCDLGLLPLSNRYLDARQLGVDEPAYPLRAWVCGNCLLVQVEQVATPEQIFSEYAYFSSYSDSWLAHAERYVKNAVARFGLDAATRVVEIASNDGYLLQYFVRLGVPVLGIEPAANVARVARDKGIDTLVEFFGERCAARVAAERGRADLIVGNNVLAHVPALNDFVKGVRLLLAPEGSATFEFPHLLRMMQGTQFDTIYHEHFCYFSLLAIERVMQYHGLRVFDIDELTTHGGSLRLYVCHRASARHAEGPTVAKVRADEKAAHLDRLEAYAGFKANAAEIRRQLLAFASQARNEGKRIAAYGAASKGVILLNYCGLREDTIDYVVDRNPYKQGRFMPGSHVPICAPGRIAETRPDYLLVLPWNLEQEIIEQNATIRAWGGKFVVPIPSVRVL